MMFDMLIQLGQHNYAFIIHDQHIHHNIIKNKAPVVHSPMSVITMHYDDVIMGAMASQITSLTIVYSTVYSGADQSKHQSSPSLAFVWGIPRGPGNSPHKWPVMRKLFPFDDVIMEKTNLTITKKPIGWWLPDFTATVFGYWLWCNM